MRQRVQSAMKFGLSAAAAALLAGSALAAGNAHLMGTIYAPGAKRHSPPPATGTAFKSYVKAQYATGGIGFRNRGVGVIHINGLSSASRAVWLYWAVLYSDTPPATMAVKVTRLYPGATDTKSVTGTLVYQPADPCWGSSTGAVYRAQVPLSLVGGNGDYQVKLPGSASKRKDGGDPWDLNTLFPAAEGASMVVVGSGSQRVAIFDFLTQEFNGSYSYTLKLPAKSTGGFSTFDAFGADGQTGGGRNATITGETMSINSVAISGSLGLNPDSDWDGNAAAPLPQLWDDTGHEISSALASGQNSLAVSLNTNGDCLIPIGNVVGYQ